MGQKVFLVRFARPLFSFAREGLVLVVDKSGLKAALRSLCVRAGVMEDEGLGTLFQLLP